LGRTRYIKPTFFSDTHVADVSRDARLLYIGLWCVLDRNGLCDYDLKLIKREVFPYDEDITLDRLNEIICELISKNRLYAFDYKSRSYIYCPFLGRHQNFHRDEKPRYKIPQEILDSCVKTHCLTDTGTIQAPSLQPANTTVNCELGTVNVEPETSATTAEFETIKVYLSRYLNKTQLEDLFVYEKRILDKFGTAEDFRIWLEDVINAKNARDETGKVRPRYLSVALLKQIGMLLDMKGSA